MPSTIKWRAIPGDISQSSFPPEMIWNLCHQIVRAYRAARDAERQIVYQAFADGRLNKRRRNHRVYVEMIAA